MAELTPTLTDRNQRRTDTIAGLNGEVFDDIGKLTGS